MKKLILLLAVLMPLTILAQNTESRQLDSFTEVSVSQGINLTLIEGNTNSADIDTETELSEVITEVSGNRLTIKLESKKKNNWKNNKEVNITLTYTEALEKLKASSSADMIAKSLLTAENLEIKASSSANITVTSESKRVKIAASSSADVKADVKADELEVKASSSADIILRGTATKVIGAASSSADIEGKNFTCQIADLSCSSSGDILMGVEEELNASASSSGDVQYKGNPRVKDLNISSSGTVRSVN